MPAAHDSRKSSDRGWIVSLLFWLCLLLAVGMYGAAALAPKYLEFLRLESVHRAGQVQLVALDRRIRTLERVARSLEEDPAFVAELARSDLHAGRPGEERLAVATEHRLEIRPGPGSFVPPLATLPWYEPLIRVFAEFSAVRRSVLFAAAVLAVAAFTFLHESRSAELHRAAGAARSTFTCLVDRYRVRK